MPQTRAFPALRDNGLVRNVTGRERKAYVRTDEPFNKAGAYAVQGIGSLIVKKIEGDYFNVIGLPLTSLAEILKQYGIRILAGLTGTIGMTDHGL